MAVDYSAKNDMAMSFSAKKLDASNYSAKNPIRVVFSEVRTDAQVAIAQI